jgi:uncharacterized CHY-type Zn-finger protein
MKAWMSSTALLAAGIALCAIAFAWFSRTPGKTSTGTPSGMPTGMLVTHGVAVYGKPVDQQTRCEHWHSDLDIIAIKFKCCEKYFPCFSCHEETVDHPPQVWPVDEFDTKAVLCGACGVELSINEYLQSNNTCPNCSAAFNPGCRKHYHLYFEQVGE